LRSKSRAHPLASIRLRRLAPRLEAAVHGVARLVLERRRAAVVHEHRSRARPNEALSWAKVVGRPRLETGSTSAAVETDCAGSVA
jgi:hypothetical protein